MSEFLLKILGMTEATYKFLLLTVQQAVDVMAMWNKKDEEEGEHTIKSFLHLLHISFISDVGQEQILYHI